MSNMFIGGYLGKESKSGVNLLETFLGSKVLYVFVVPLFLCSGIHGRFEECLIVEE